MFEEIVNPPMNYREGYMEAGFHISRFRPLITQSDDVAKFTQLLNTTDERVDA